MYRWLKVNALILFLSIGTFFCISPFGLSKVKLTIIHNLYIGGYPSRAYISIDYEDKDMILSPDTITYEVTRGSHTLSIDIHKQEKIVSNGNYVYWGEESQNIKFDDDKTIKTYDFVE